MVPDFLILVPPHFQEVSFFNFWKKLSKRVGKMCNFSCFSLSMHSKIFTLTNWHYIFWVNSEFFSLILVHIDFTINPGFTNISNHIKTVNIKISELHLVVAILMTKNKGLLFFCDFGCNQKAAIKICYLKTSFTTSTCHFLT